MRTSLVMPTWNAGPLLDEVLESVLAIRGTCFAELCAVDSGSTDGTQERLRDAGFQVEVIPQREFDHGSTRDRGIAATIPERDDQIAHRRKKPGRPIDFGDQQQERYKGRNIVERCFNKLKQWRGIAMRSDKTARSYRAAVSLAATLIWIKSDLINTA